MAAPPSQSSSKIEIRLTCHHLANLDVRSKSDPFVVLFIKDGQDSNSQWKPFDKTETVQDQLNPAFAKPFILDYVFEKSVKLKFEVYDQDSKVRNLTNDLKNHDFMGSAETKLADLVHAPGQTQTKALKNRMGRKQKGEGSRLSMITFHVEEVSNCADLIHFQLRGHKFPKKDWFGAGDPYYEIFRLREDNSWVKVYKSEYIANTKKPNWKKVTLKMQEVCNGDPQRPIKIVVWDWESNDEPDLYGEVETSIQDLASGNITGTLKLRQKGKNKTYGELILVKCEIEKRHTFMEFLAGGMDMQLLCAIDFTGSNGHPADYGTLHFREGPQRLSPYLKAIWDCGNVLAPYDTDGMIPVWGFGANINGRVDHCFPLNFNSHNPEVSGIQGVVDAYHNALDRGQMQFSGPTLFKQILMNAITIASTPQPSDRVNYFILFILTDGVINDMQQSIDAICQASELPLSIVIVGVGNADFTDMDRLDGDDGILRNSRGAPATGDIVQFVPMNNFQGMPPGALAEETMREIPGQFINYMTRNGISPKPRTHAQDLQSVEAMLLSQQTMMGADLTGQQQNFSAPPIPPPTQQLPPGWSSQFDQNSGRTYYVNHQTQQTQWEFPVGTN